MGRLFTAVTCLALVGLGSARGQYFPQQGGYGQGQGQGGMNAFGGYGSGGFGSQIAPGPYMNQGPYAPNQYNRSTQPLSPYLNLLRGSNPAVNYFYGVRPGTMPNMAGSGGFNPVAQG